MSCIQEVTLLPDSFFIWTGSVHVSPSEEVVMYPFWLMATNIPSLYIRNDQLIDTACTRVFHDWPSTDVVNTHNILWFICDLADLCGFWLFNTGSGYRTNRLIRHSCFEDVLHTFPTASIQTEFCFSCPHPIRNFPRRQRPRPDPRFIFVPPRPLTSRGGV